MNESFQLRYLQTLNGIAAEHNSTIVFPVPIDILSNFMNPLSQSGQQGFFLFFIYFFLQTAEMEAECWGDLKPY